MSWTFETLQVLLAQQALSWVIQSEEACLSVSNDEGIDAFIYVGEQQIIVEAPLFPLASVQNVMGLNDLILRTHQLQPLTTIGIKTIASEDYYIAFGALSVDSKDHVVVEEVETLFANVGDFLELYTQYLKKEVA